MTTGTSLMTDIFRISLLCHFHSQHIVHEAIFRVNPTDGKGLFAVKVQSLKQPSVDLMLCPSNLIHSFKATQCPHKKETFQHYSASKYVDIHYPVPFSVRRKHIEGTFF